MRKPVRIAALLFVMVALLAPMAAYADGPWGAPCGCGPCVAPCTGDPCVGVSTTGPCPDDLELSKTCNQEAPPYYVVINRAVECPNRPGTGCSPFILKHPECTDCTSAACNIDVQAEVCKPKLTGKVARGETAILYEMCCGGTAGGWRFRVRLLDSEGNCPLDPENSQWVEGRLPPGTGIDLPTPVIVGGLTLLGAAFLAVGVVIRRRAR